MTDEIAILKMVSTLDQRSSEDESTDQNPEAKNFSLQT